ncbi:MAG: hypothetical protein K2X26_09885 [Chitinophagaceae bacterium]|nr:hypothetical protein [Chitinophagaceae bacterium]
MPKEKHPYIEKHFDASRPWKYLIIGTFPPNKEVREGNKSLTDYFYGNKGSLWKILGKMYSDFDFEKGSRKQLIKQMKTWQLKYDIGITDTLISVSRTDIKSADDADLILEHDDYYHKLKDYILTNNNNIESIIFTSSAHRNSAFETFKIIMGAEIKKVKAKLITNLPSPSGSSNTSWFNVNNEATLGLHPDFFAFIKSEKKEHLPFFQQRWDLKKKKKAEKSKAKLPKTPKGLVNDFKVWSYKKVLPKQMA